MKIGLPEKSAFKGKFKQTRFLKSSNLKLISSGSFNASSDDQAIEWLQLSPFQLKILLLKDKIVTEIEGQDPKIITENENPWIFQFAKVFGSLIKGDFEKLENSFNYKIKNNNSNKSWKVTLEQKDKILKKGLKYIEIGGSHIINSFYLEDSTGDSLTVEFIY